MSSEENIYYQQRLETLEQIRAEGKNPYPNQFRLSHSLKEICDAYDSRDKEALLAEKISVKIAGRVMFVRSFGKAAFVKLKDRSGVLQAYVKKGEISEEDFLSFKKLDVGDFAYIEGYLFRTKTDELSVHAEGFQLAVKGLRNLPEKFHGLSDIETRYRQRYLDLIMSEESKEVFRKRSMIVQKIREFLCQKEYFEVETPMMHPIPGGAAAKPFVTHHNALDMDLYLRIAPELYLKRLVVGGFERVFEINRNFRNEGISIQHNPEFTMLEFYQAYATFEDLIDLTEEMFSFLAQEVCGSDKIMYQGTELSFAKGFRRIKLYDSIIEIGGAPAEVLQSKEAALAFAKSQEIHLKSAKEDLPVILTEIFEELVEGKLIQPTFVTHYPIAVSPLSRRNDEDHDLSDRFELFIFGREIANGFSELNDPLDQKRRFQAQVEARGRGDEEAMFMDEDYVTALEYGMPPTAGEGIGIDRLVMLLTDQASIRDVILFPQLKRKKD